MRWNHVVVALGLILLFGSAPMLAQKHKPFNNQAESTAEELRSNRDLPPTEYKAINWPSSNELDKVLRSQLSAYALSNVNASPVPVLVPSEISASGTKYTLVARPDGYFISGSLSGESFVLHGMLSPVNFSDKSSSLSSLRSHLRGAPATIGHSEGVWTVSWSERGAVYFLQFVCDATSDNQCENVENIRSLVESLTFIGGMNE